MNDLIEYVAACMGMKPHTEVIGAERVDGGVCVTTKDGQVTVLGIDLDCGQTDATESDAWRAANPTIGIGPDWGAAYTPDPDIDPDSDVPEGTIPEVLDWVRAGNVAERAANAWEVESDRPKPRSVLIAALEKLIGGSE